MNENGNDSIDLAWSEMQAAARRAADDPAKAAEAAGAASSDKRADMVIEMMVGTIAVAAAHGVDPMVYFTSHVMAAAEAVRTQYGWSEAEVKARACDVVETAFEQKPATVLMRRINAEIIKIILRNLRRGR